MSFIKLYKKSVIVAYNRKILFLTGSDCYSYEIKSTELPLEKCRPRKYFDADSDSEGDDGEGGQTKQQPLDKNGTKEHAEGEKVQIVALEVFESRSLLAVATSDKSLYLFEIVDEKADREVRLLSRRPVVRTSSCMKFASSGQFLVVCDKGGDCYKYDCVDTKKPGRWLLGHMSQILDVLISEDEKLIITSDRDEKIRVTNHPDAHSIETFCLGHTEFVSHLQFLPQPAEGGGSLLLSTSGDKTLRLWDIKTGQQKAKKELEKSGSVFVSRKLNDGALVLAILCYEPTTITILKVEDAESLKGEAIQDLEAESGQVFTYLEFDDEGNLLTLTTDKTTEKLSLGVYAFDTENSKFAKNTSHPLTNTFAKNSESDTLPYVDSVSFLFKKKFDNLKDYHERKRKRIEESK